MNWPFHWRGLFFAIMLKSIRHNAEKYLSQNDTGVYLQKIVLLTNVFFPIVVEGQTGQLSHFGRLAFSLATWIYASLGHLLVGNGFKLSPSSREIGVLSGGGCWSEDGPRMWMNPAWAVHPINQQAVSSVRCEQASRIFEVRSCVGLLWETGARRFTISCHGLRTWNAVLRRTQLTVWSRSAFSWDDIV